MGLGRINDIICKSYNSIYVIDTEKRVMEPYYLGNLVSKSMAERIVMIRNYDMVFAEFASRYVIPDEMDIFLTSTTLDFVIRQVDENNAYKYTFRRFDTSDSIEFVELYASRLDDNLLLMTFRSVTEDVMQYQRVKNEITKRDENGKVIYKILIIDSDSERLEMLERSLCRDYFVLTASCCREGSAIMKEYYGLISALIVGNRILMDDDCSALSQKASDPVLSTIPVLLLSDDISEKDYDRYFSMGISDIVRKPYSVPVIRNRLSNFIRMGEADSALYAMEKDNLTGVYTKEAFYHHVENHMRLDKERKYIFFMTDIEHFKLINSRYGKSVGDEILRTIADRIQQLLPRGIVCRFGRDQFAAMTEYNEDIGKDIINDILHDITGSLPVPHVVMKVGVYKDVPALMPASNICDRLLIALLSIKGRYGRDVAYYDSKMREHLNRIQLIIEHMEDSLKEERFIIDYQAKYDCSTDRIAGAEALVRWNHPVLGMLQPLDFIPSFEENGFICKLDSYVIGRVCDDISKWKEMGIDRIPVSVNVSYRDIVEEGWAQKQIDTVRSKGVSSRLLHIELKESVYYNDISPVKEEIRRIRESGCKIEIDDFGKAWSSFSALLDVPADVVKIDRTMIEDIGSNELIVDTLINLSHRMNFRVAAEGVENYQQYTVLKNLGCDIIQGFYLSRPVSSDEFVQLVLSEENESNDKKITSVRWNSFTKEYEIRNALLECIRTLSECTDERSRIAGLLTIIGEFYGADRASVFEFDSRSSTFSISYEWCNEDVESLDMEINSPDSESIRKWFDDISKGESLFIAAIDDEYDESSSVYRAFRAKGITSIMATALKTENEPVGYVCVHNPTVHFDTMILIQSIASYLVADLERIRNFNELHQISYLDALTGLNNRRAYFEYLRKNDIGNDWRSTAVAFIDINGLKNVNDSRGHKAGDQLIRSVADILKMNFSADSIFRIGGDEFVVIIRGISREAFEDRIDKLNSLWCEEVSAAVGHVWEEKGGRIERLVNGADEEMYRNKKEYHNNESKYSKQH